MPDSEADEYVGREPTETTDTIHTFPVEAEPAEPRCGDVVRSVHGGPNMLVIQRLSHAPDVMMCIWAQGGDTIRQGFPPSSLTVIVPAPPQPR